jgi:exopolysaccharide production protein ExoZ
VPDIATGAIPLGTRQMPLDIGRRQFISAPDLAALAGASTVVTIQYLRAIAASLVVYHHAFAPTALHSYYKTPFGEFGVDIFFVISGYIMWTTTVGSGRGPISFWLARIMRIVPLYWLYTTLFLTAATFLGPQVLFTPAGLDPLFVLKSYLFIPAAHPYNGDIVPVYSLGWTLNYEMFFYFCFGLSLLLARPTLRFYVFSAAFFLLALTGYVAAPQETILSTYTNSLLLEFLAGVALAVLGPSLMRLPTSLGILAVLLGVAWLIFALRSDPSQIRILTYGVPAALVVGGILVLEPVARLRPSRIALLLGAASYSIYLAHPFAQRIWFFVMNFFFFTIDSPAVTGLSVGGAILFGILGGVVSWLVVEIPLLRIGHALIKRRMNKDPQAQISRKVSGLSP